MPYAGPGEARDAIYGFLEQGLTTYLPGWAPVLVVADREAPGPTTDQSPYIRVILTHDDRRQRSVGGAGGRRFRAKFQLTLKVYTKMDQGLDDYTVGETAYPGNDSIVGALLHIFEGKTTGVDAVQFYRVRSQEYGEDEGRFRTNVLINGDYDTVR